MSYPTRARHHNATLTSLEELRGQLQEWRISVEEDKRRLVALFDDIYCIEHEQAKLTLVGYMRTNMAAWLGCNEDQLEEAENQTVILMTNKVHNQSTLFNPLRVKRPKPKRTTSPTERAAALAKESAASCDFCDGRFRKCTAADAFGRIESHQSYSATNAFKFGAFHSMAVFRGHDPVNWSLAQLTDTFHTALRWFELTNKTEPSCTHPVIVWDSLPNAGASQIHPHLHMLFGANGHYPGQLASWHRQAAEYQARSLSDHAYITDLVELHSALGLAVNHSTAWAMASLTPTRSHEVEIVSPQCDNKFLELLYAVMRVFLDDLEQLAFSLAVTLPPFGASSSYPVLARLVPRGGGLDYVSDTCSLELFVAPNVNSEPFHTIRLVQNSVNSRLISTQSREVSAQVGDS